ncbi:MAG: sensor histidine kinase [Sandaracinaceae bacterium]
MRRLRWDLIGAGLLFVTSLVDLVMFEAFDLDVAALGAGWIGRAVLASFVGGYAVLGFALGRLWMARERAIADAARIADQHAELDASQQKLAHAEKLAALGRLSASIAHEVRNPLGVIRASLSMVQDNFDAGTDDHRACELAVDEIDRLDGLIGALLAFAKPTKLAASEVALDPLIERAATVARETVALEVARKGTDRTLRADPDLLTQLVLGLLINAGQAGARRAEVRARSDGDAIWLEVGDDGPGIAADAAGHVFEPFFTTKAKGTGLGLPMALRIAEAHGGSIEVGHDDAMGGARFVVRLPASGASARAAA